MTLESCKSLPISGPSSQCLYLDGAADDLGMRLRMRASWSYPGLNTQQGCSIGTSVFPATPTGC